VDIIWRFQNKHCKEDESVRNHFKYLTDLCEQLAAMGKVVIDKVLPALRSPACSDLPHLM